MKHPKVVCVGGSDSSGGAGIQADIKTFSALGVHAHTILTSVTSQTELRVLAVMPVSPEMLIKQWESIAESGEELVVKVGQIPSDEMLEVLVHCLNRQRSFVIYDPVITSSSGFEIGPSVEAIRAFLPRVDLLTPNLDELERISGISGDIEGAATKVIELGARAVLAKGGHCENQNSSDFFMSGEKSFWMHSPRQEFSARGTGCTFASAIAAFLSRDEELPEAILQAKSFLNQCLVGSYQMDKSRFLGYQKWPGTESTFPWIGNCESKVSFAECDPLGFYPIVDRLSWLERLLPLGVKSAQLRIKDLRGRELEYEIATSIAFAKKYDCKLYINDYWDAAIRHGAYGVHLGQTDVARADFRDLHRYGLRVGISTHSYEEAAIAHGLRPSYVALGPIYPTTTKEMPFAPQGLERIGLWKKLFPYPLVAIGGLDINRGEKAMRAGADGVAVITDITESENPELRTRSWLELIEGFNGN